jgi:3-isopropylmalate dehydrogenase
MADKSNVMQHAHGLWQRVFKIVAAEYPAIEASHLYVDALTLLMVREPESFEVIVTNNMFGDIVTDLAAALQGGLGVAASANTIPGAPRCTSRCTARDRSLPARAWRIRSARCSPRR